MKQRDLTIDSLRGIAIFAMIAANMGAYNYTEPHPFAFRMYGSLAAPTFIFLSGLLVPFTQSYSTKSFGNFIKRGSMIIFIAAAVDILIWRLIPFSSFDVLYIIGIAVIINYLLLKMNHWIHLMISVMVILFTPIIQMIYGYSNSPFEIMLSEENLFQNWKDGPVLKNLFIEGWFPIFPWLGLSLFGSFVGRFYIKIGIKKRQKFFGYFGALLLLLGISIWSIAQPNLITRSGYSELFYPPTLCYIFTYCGLIFLGLTYINNINSAFLMKIFAVYGQSSLLTYVLHSLFIARFFNLHFGALSFVNFLQLYFFHAFLLWWIAKFTQLIKPELKKAPFLIRFLIGT